MAGIKDWAIEQFGDNDKLFLQSGVVAGMLVLAVVAGLMTRLRFGAGAALMVAMVAAPVLVIVTRPVFEVVDLVPAVRLGRHRGHGPAARRRGDVARHRRGAPRRGPHQRPAG